jgi:hypothetical protein
MRAGVAALVAAGALGLTLAGSAAAHTMSDGHLVLVPDGRRLVGTLDVAVRDLHDAFGLDPGGDGAITWADVTARRAAIATYVAEHLTIASDDGPCGITTGVLGVVDRPDGSHVSVALSATCPSAAAAVTVDYRMLYELDAQHRGLLHVGDGRAIARDGAGPVRITVRSGVLAAMGGAMPGGPIALAIAGALIALALAVLILRRTTPHALPVVLAIAVVVSAPVWWSLHRLVS